MAPLLTEEVERALAWAQSAIEADPGAYASKAERAAAAKVLVDLRNRLYEIDETSAAFEASP